MSTTKASTVPTMVHQDRKGRKEALISITPRRPRHFLCDIILSRSNLQRGRVGWWGWAKFDEQNSFLVLFFAVAGETKLGNNMGERILTGKPINFGKSSGGKEEASHLRKLDSSNEIPEKNYVQEKSFFSSKTITREEFQRRKALFENLGGKVTELRWGRRRVRNVARAQEGKKRSESFFRRFRLLESLSGNQCQAKELEMSQKLKEIHELVQKMQKVAEIKEREKEGGGEAFSEWGSRARENGGKNRALASFTFESRCNFDRKLVPIQFSSSFVAELGSHWKSFSEKIIFKSVFIPLGEEKSRKTFRSTLEIICRPETEMKIKKPSILL